MTTYRNIFARDRAVIKFILTRITRFTSANTYKVKRMIILNDFEKMVMADHKNIFLNANELRKMHNLNGTKCIASVQTLSTPNQLSMNEDYIGLYGSKIYVFCDKIDLPEVPVYGQSFSLDDKFYLVENCSNDMGMLKITLVANDR